MNVNRDNIVKLFRSNNEPTFSAFYDLHADYLDHYYSRQIIDTSILWMPKGPNEQLKSKRSTPLHFTRDTTYRRGSKEFSPKSDDILLIKTDSLKQIEESKSIEFSNESSSESKDNVKDSVVRLSRDVALLKHASFSSSDESPTNETPTNETPTNEPVKGNRFAEYLHIIDRKDYVIIYDQTDVELHGMYDVTFHQNNTIIIRVCTRRSYDLVVKEGYRGKFLHYSSTDNSVQVKSRFHDYPDHKLYSVYLREWDKATECPIYVKCDNPCDISTFVKIFPILFEYILRNQDDDSTL